MDKETEILYEAMQKIAQGTPDDEAPFRCVPREVLQKYARDALIHFEAGREAEGENVPF